VGLLDSNTDDPRCIIAHQSKILNHFSFYEYIFVGEKKVLQTFSGFTPGNFVFAT
jgi:urocanate hydratase